ncbi:MAG: hypothetical protein V1913_16640 [Fibrobacterota bacterium]
MNRTDPAARLRALLFLLFLVAAPHPWAVDTSASDLAGSQRCQRCHGAVHAQWHNTLGRKECESCHGPGRAHVLAPTARNITLPRTPGFRHGTDKPPLAAPRDTLRVDLFVMSHCPYGISALRTLLPLLSRWKQETRFTLYFIAHRRGDTLQPAVKTTADADLGGNTEKCETPEGMTDGTDRYVSLHGLEEVLEDQRQCIVQERFPKKLYAYLAERVRDITGDWKKAATRAGFTHKEITDVTARMDTPWADSLFDANIAVAGRLRISGSPTLYINGEEFAEGAAPYPVERHFCQNATRRGPCKGFPACGFDADCVREGFEGTCENPMTAAAKCRFAPAARFTCTVVNDEACPTCHTGNLIAEIKKRFPGARLDFVPLSSDTGRTLISHYGLTFYPAFLFDTLALGSGKFKDIAHTFTRVKDRFLLNAQVVKTYHFLGRKPDPGTLALFGAFENPPFIEMLRDLAPFLLDSVRPAGFTLHPVAFANEKKGAAWFDGFESPYGPAEVREGARSRCAQALFPATQALRYMVCRGYNIQARFESHAPEPEGEWKACADSFGLATEKLTACTDGPRGEALFRQSLLLADSAGVNDPAPSFLVNNYFKVSGYHPAVRRTLARELLGKGTDR